jgi:prepilin-type N-terminal cleavage/methylation domain-containing protein
MRSMMLDRRPLSVVRCPLNSGRPQTTDHGPRTARGGFTLVEMLIAMAITLVMIGAVVTLFANISNGVRNRRAVIEMSGQMRHARNMLQQDLAGATCNGLVWQRADENQGYIEIIEGVRREGQASVLVDGMDQPDPSSSGYNPEIDHKTSIIPASNIPFADSTWLTDGGSLGDYDDILMLTVRNEHEPFVGRVPKSDGATGAVRVGTGNPNSFDQWGATTATSPLAEVVWYAVENPDEDSNVDGFFGEPGMRTIYRRALLIAPWLNPYRYTEPNGTIHDTFNFDGGSFTAQPGLLRILRDNINNTSPLHRQQAIAALIAFQEEFDISARLEWDPLMGSDGRWKIVANTLGDLTKRENRYEHHFFRHGNQRTFPFAVASIGSGYTGGSVNFVLDPEIADAYTVADPAQATAIRDSNAAANVNNYISAYTIANPDDANGPYRLRPFAFVASNSGTVATARAMLNDEGKVVRVVYGLVPLSGKRRGEDVMLSDALGFDLRVYDPGAPIFAHRESETVLEPTDPAWLNAYVSPNNSTSSGTVSSIGLGNTSSPIFPFIGQGAYVDLGYGFDPRRAAAPSLPAPAFTAAYANSTLPWFFTARALSDVFGNQLAPGYAVFDTWSFHYENNGLNEDRDEVEGGLLQPDDNNGSGTPLVDEGTNGLDDFGHYSDGNFVRLGPDDVGERETVPPYDKPLRGVQVLMRLYERDSRQVKQVSVNQSFVPE